MEVLGLLITFTVMLLIIYTAYSFIDEIWVVLFILTIWSMSLIVFISSILNIYGVGD